MLPVPKEIGTLDRSVPAMAESGLVLSGSLPIARKAVHVAFDGGRLTSDAGVLVLAEVERESMQNRGGLVPAWVKIPAHGGRGGRCRSWCGG